jgi:hypothetical protein
MERVENQPVGANGPKGTGRIRELLGDLLTGPGNGAR